MPINYQFLNHAVCMKASGVFKPEEVAGTIEQILNDSRFLSGMRFIIDFTQAEAEKFQSKTVIASVSKTAPLITRFDHRLMVVIATPLQYGFSGMYQVYAEKYGLDVQIFKNLEDACLAAGEAM